MRVRTSGAQKLCSKVMFELMCIAVDKCGLTDRDGSVYLYTYLYLSCHRAKIMPAILTGTRAPFQPWLVCSVLFHHHYDSHVRFSAPPPQPALTALTIAPTTLSCVPYCSSLDRRLALQVRFAQFEFFLRPACGDASVLLRSHSCIYSCMHPLDHLCQTSTQSSIYGTI